MKKLIALVALFCGMLFSGCTVSRFYYMRNLTEHPTTLYFSFSTTAMRGILPDSIYVPYAASSHLINKNTFTYMTDSVVCKKYGLSKMKLVLPAGGMIMIDKVTSGKLHYQDPEIIEVLVPGKDAYQVRIVSHEGSKAFKSKGKLPQLYWFDIY